MTLQLRRCGWILLSCFLASHAWAGGIGLNVVVVVNQNSTNSVQLGNYYCEKRQVPPQNLLRINWSGSRVEWTNADFKAYLLNPLLAMLASRQLTNQIDYVVLSMDIPYRVYQHGAAAVDGTDSTTSALFYGFKSDYVVPSYSPTSCSLPAATANSYAGSEAIFRLVPPATATTNAFLAMMITSSNLALAKAIIDQGVASDSSFPSQTAFLAKSDDRLRNVRYRLFDNAIFNTRLRGNLSLQRTNTNLPDGLGYLLGFQTGLQNYTVGPGVFAPGAMADNLTSYGGRLFEPNDHTSLLPFLNAGACASYGTVIEPCNYLQKFPSPQIYFYQARGFNVAECYYQGVTNPYQGILVGEPLAAPFAQRALGAWMGLPAEAILTGTTNLSLQFDAADPLHPIQQVHLFLDGLYLRSLTNLPPGTNNLLSVILNGYPTNYTVPAGATVASVTSNLVLRLNRTGYSNATRVVAVAHGDRIELRSLDLGRSATQTTLTADSSAGTAPLLTSWIASSGGSFLDTTAWGIRSYLITNAPRVGDYLQLLAIKTNGQAVVVSVTNTVAGTTLADLAKTLFSAANTNDALQTADGLVVEDINMHEDFPYSPYIYGTNDHSGEFNLRARSQGWAAAQVRVCVRGSSTFNIQPAGTNFLDENLTDLQPRAHLYLTAGVTNLPMTFPLDTSVLADGFHELTAVAYEGSHVRTQCRISQNVRIQNGSLGATFQTVYGGTNTDLGATLQFLVVANTNAISKIELFSTGGSLGSVLNQSSANFSVAGTAMGLGQHPFSAVVTDNGGRRYRTETHWIRLVGPETAFLVAVAASPLALSWPATAGRSYDVLSSTSPTNSFQVQSTVTPSNSAARWIETNSAEAQRFYRVRTTGPAAP